MDDGQRKRSKTGERGVYKDHDEEAQRPVSMEGNKLARNWSL